MDAWSFHYDAIYNNPMIAVDAVLTVACGNPPETIRAIDKTVGQLVNFKGVDVATIGPSACVRVSELAEKGLAADDVDDGVLTLNGKDWTIISHEAIPAPTGEAGGELRLMLSEK
ncbi:MAG: hypothetical protein EOR77_21615 [Mesorhizobium sp.]|uniref:hypothetical protein n=1 Tax=Mesorhizobium sp. TaxID=1871066 RepID=UPI000FE997A2|nr:hypothetical protein [Mesorhizobium sp.]RWM32273.1 MAG: hypothetical protein EOR77_21615 [Mesorhizobium sp.]